MFKYVRQIFTGGMNQDIDPAAIDLTSQDEITQTIVATCTNFMFIRGLIQSRPPLQGPSDTVASTFTIPCNSVAPSYSMFPLNASNPYFLMYNNGITPIEQVNTTAAFKFKTALTGPAITMAYSGVIGGAATSVDGVVLFSGYNQGMAKWVPGATSYTLISPSGISWVYLTKLYSRAVGAYNVLNGSGLGQVQVGASAAGDPTDWTSVNAYNTTLADVDDYINGLTTIRGNIVVARSHGFHVGFPTGTFPNIFNWAAYSFGDVGAGPATSLATYGNKAYFVGNQGIFTFDLNSIENISEGINAEIAQSLLDQQLLGFQNNTVQGFVINSGIIDDYRPMYIVGPFSTNVSSIYWAYDIIERKWARFVFSSGAGTFGGSGPFASSCANYFKSSSSPSRLNFVGSQEYMSFLYDNQDASGNTNLYRCGYHNYSLSPADSTTPDQPCSFVTGQLSLSPSYIDAELSRILLVFFVPSAVVGHAPTITVTSILSNVATSTPFNPISSNIQAGWNRVWYSARVTGQMFQATVTFPTAINVWPIKVKEMVMEFTDIGKQRI